MRCNRDYVVEAQFGPVTSVQQFATAEEADRYAEQLWAAGVDAGKWRQHYQHRAASWWDRAMGLTAQPWAEVDEDRLPRHRADA